MTKQPEVRLASYCPPTGVGNSIGGLSYSWEGSASQGSPPRPMPSLLGPERPEFINTEHGFLSKIA